MSRKHRNVSVSQLKPDCRRHLLQDEPDHVDGEESTIVQQPHNDDINLTSLIRNIALLPLKMKAEYSVPESTVQLIVQHFGKLMHLSQDHSLCQIRDLCNKYNITDGA